MKYYWELNATLNAKCFRFVFETVHWKWSKCVVVSAGIGRTGVLITMETAMCLIEVNRHLKTLLFWRSFPWLFFLSHDSTESLQLARDVDARRCLRSAVSMTLVVPAMHCSTLGDRAFPLSAARTWNALPSDVRAAPSLTTFWHELKQTLFLQSFPDQWQCVCTVPL